MKLFKHCLYGSFVSAILCVSQLNYANPAFEAFRQGKYQLAAKLLPLNEQNPLAYYYLGIMRAYGYGLSRNNRLALTYMHQAGYKGIFAAQQFLGRYYLTVVNNPTQALEWFKKTAAAGDIDAQVYCAAAYLYGFGTKKNHDLAKKYYLEAAKRGSAVGQLALAEDFLSSRDRSNRRLGQLWLAKAVAQGNAKAQFKLAELYLNSPQDKANISEARFFLAKAAKQDYQPAILQLGILSLAAKQWDRAHALLTKAISSDSAIAELNLARLYLNSNNPDYNIQDGVKWLNQAAVKQEKTAQLALKLMQHAKIIENINFVANKNINSRLQSSESDRSLNELMAKWVSADKTTSLANTQYNLGGIYSNWQNKNLLKDNTYNYYPTIPDINRSRIYRPNFIMTQPDEIAISDYFNAIALGLHVNPPAIFSFPRYNLASAVETLQHGDALVVAPKINIMPPLDGVALKEQPKPFNYIEALTEGWEKQANYQAVLNKLYNKAILGEAAAQFELGQLYHYGVIVAKNPQQAIAYYQLAAIQQELRAEYNLALLYLEGKTNPVDYQRGMHWLMDAAFKGNTYAQYTLARLYEEGLQGLNGEVIIAPDKEKALSIYYLAAANNYGPAEYQLAEHLVSQQKKELNVVTQAEQRKIIKNLYQNAVKHGILEARLPLAFYNVMENNRDKQQQALMVAKTEAEQGNINAVLLLGMLYERGIAVAANQQEALHWYNQALSHPVGAFILGTYYSQGKIVNKNLIKGQELLEQAANQQFPFAYLNLAILQQQENKDFLPTLLKAKSLGNSTAGLLLADYYLSAGNDADKIAEALDIYNYFARHEDKIAELKLGYIYDKGINGNVDMAKAKYWYSLAAAQGEPKAQYLLAQFYQLGKGEVAPNYGEAIKWYRNALSSGNKDAAVALGFLAETIENDYSKALSNYQLANTQKDALFNQGLLYAQGKGTAVDYDKAKSLYFQAANLNHKEAMAQLAHLYFYGLGGSRDIGQALSWYNKAADLGEPSALYQLGLLSETGVGMNLDLANARKYYEQAADKNHDSAKLALARIYLYGLGTDVNIEKAVNFYTELAAKNNAYAQYQLALIYFQDTARDVPGNANVAQRLLEKASSNGSSQASRALHWLQATHQNNLSFIEPFSTAKLPVLSEQPAELLYLEALNVWNSGNEVLSRMILDKLILEFPHYLPAKSTYEHLIRQPQVV